MIIGMCGRIGAGKETLIQYLVYKGFAYLETSKLFTEELLRRGLEVNRTNQQDLADEWRGKDGVGALMKMFLDKIDMKRNYITLLELRTIPFLLWWLQPGHPEALEG